MSDLLRKTAEATASDDEKARRAVKAFRKLQPSLSAYARILTKRRDVRVEMAPSDNGSTDGKRIFFRPPLALGDNTPHDRRLCDKRGDDKILLCKACDVRESVMVTIYHEIAHICYETFAPVAEDDLKRTVKDAIAQHGTKYGAQIEAKIANAPWYVKNSYLGLSNVISPYMPKIVNALEDARVNNAQFAARPGVKVMFEADTARIFTEGVEQRDSATGQTKTVMWNEYPANAQVVVGIFLKAAGIDYAEYLHPDVVEALNDEQLTAIIRKMRTVRNAAGTYHLAFPVLARLRELGYCKHESDPQPEPEPEPEPEEPQPQPEEEKSDEEQDSDGDASQDSPEPDEGDGEGSDEGHESGGAEDAPPSSDEGEAEPDVPQSDDSSGDSAGGSEQDEQPDSDGSGSEDKESDSDGNSGDDSGADLGEPPTEDGAGGGGSDKHSYDTGESGSDGEHDDASGEDAPRPEGSEPSEGGNSSEGEPADGSDDGDAPAGDPAQPGSDQGEDVDADGDGDPAEAGDGEGAPQDGVGTAGGGSSSGEDDSADGEPGGEGTDRPEVGSGSGQHESSEDGPKGEGEGTDSPEGDGVSSEAGTEASDGDAGGTDASSDRDVPPVSDGSDDDSHARSDAGEADEREPVDSGADDGTGGVEVVRDPDKPEPEPVALGEPEDVDEPLKVFMGHPDQPKQVEEAEAALMDRAIVQGLYFETPSKNIFGVREHKYGEPQMVEGKNMSTGWRADEYVSLWGSPKETGVEGDFDPSETVLGPALMRMRVAFSDNARGHENRHLKSGKVDARVLGKRAPLHDERLFKRRILPGKKDYFVLIGMDISGSTVGKNLILEKKAVMAQAMLLHRMGVKFAIFAHSGNYHNPTDYGKSGLDLEMYFVKEAHEPWTEKVAERLRNLCPSAANLDGHSMEYYRKYLDKQDATDKVLLYYTDGKMPAENHDEELEILQREINIFRQKKYTLLGVGIRTDSPIRHGLDTVQVDEEEDVVKVVKHIEKRLVTR